MTPAEYAEHIRRIVDAAPPLTSEDAALVRDWLGLPSAPASAA